MALITSALGIATPSAAAPDGTTALVVATYSYGSRDREAAIRPLAAYLAAELGRRVQTRIYDSPTRLVEALERGETHVAVPNLTAFLASDPTRACAAAVADVPADDAARYRSVWLARRETSITTLASLAALIGELRVVLPSADSASGALIPLQALQAQRGGPEATARPLSLKYAGSHEAALEALRGGQADVAALAADIWDRSPDDGLVELWRSEPIPPGPILCARQVAPCARIARALAAAHQAPDVQAALNAGWPEYGKARRLKPPGPELLALPQARGAGADCPQPPA